MSDQIIVDEGNAIEAMAKSEGWKVLSKWLTEESSAEALRGATKDNFESIKARINSYRAVLDKVDEYINAKNDELA